MASGDTLCVFTAGDNEAPASSYAVVDQRNGHYVIDFDAAADESAIFRGILPQNYGGGGLTVVIHWRATSATSGTVRWATAFEALSGQDIDSDGFATAKTTGGTASGTSGIETVTSIAHSNSEIDGLAAGGEFRLKLTRDADGTSGTDDMTGDAEVSSIEIKEA